MLAVDEPTIALPLLARHSADASGDRGGGASQPAPPTRRGASVYHCFRYESAVDPVPLYANGTAVAHLPADPREWRVRPWREYEATALYDADTATSWLGAQLRAATEVSGTRSAVIEQWIAAIADECTEALLTMVSAYQTVVELSGGNLLALAVVGIWDSSQIYPLLRGLAAPSEQAGP